MVINYGNIIVQERWENLYKIQGFLKNFWKWKPYLKAKYNIDTDIPSKKSSRYIYFGKEGDYLNG